MKLTPQQRRALGLLTEPNAVCRRYWTRLEVSGRAVPATTMWRLKDRGLVDYASVNGKDEFRINAAGRAAVS